MLPQWEKKNIKEVYSEVQTLLAEAGFPQVLSVSNKLEAITALCVHSVILSRKAELDQFAVGLGPVLGVAMKYPDMMKSMFVSCSEPVLHQQRLKTYWFLKMCMIK